MYFELMASMMCANYAHLETEVKSLKEGGIDSFHIDIMDSRYVPNYTMSLNAMRYIAEQLKITTPQDFERFRSAVGCR